MLRIRLNMDGLKPLFDSLSKKEIQKAMKRAVKLAARKTKTKSIDIASKEYSLKKKDLRKRIWSKDNLGTKEHPGAVIEFQFKSIGLENFNVRETKAGVKAKVHRSGGAIVLKNSFLAKPKKNSSRKFVFVRKNALTPAVRKFVPKVPSGGIRRGASGSELPIVKLKATGLSDVMTPHAPALVKVAGTEGQKELKRQINLTLGR